MKKNQIAAINSSIRLGRVLQTAHPEIADLYQGTKDKKGLSYRQIDEELNISSTYNIGKNISINVIHHAMTGNSNPKFHETYPGLIEDDSLLEKLAREHQSEAGKNSDHRKGGKTTYEQSKGIFSQTEEQWRETRRKAGVNGAISKGQVLWTDNEKNYVYALSLFPQYQVPKGLNNDAIRDQVNALFHKGKDVRSRLSVKSMLALYRKKLRED